MHVLSPGTGSRVFEHFVTHVVSVSAQEIISPQCDPQTARAHYAWQHV